MGALPSHNMKTSTNLVRIAATVAALGAGLSSVLAAPHAKVGVARANAVVLRRFPGKLTAPTTLENEEGKWQYGVMVRSGRTLREVMVDAYTGKIADIEVTSVAKERVEKKQDAADAAKAKRASATANSPAPKSRK